MADKTLASFTAGIDRTRQRAIAKTGTFWKLTNCYVTPGQTIAKRPAFRHVARLDAGTKGLFANGSRLRTFYSDGMLTAPPGVNIVYHALRMTAGADGTTPSLVKVYSDHLFLGKQYVAAEFAGGLLLHYWLQNPKAWAAGTKYDANEQVQPSAPNGYYYVASADEAPAAWAPNVPRAVGDVVQPTVYNGWKYTASEVAGGNPASGATEPTWLATDGAVVYEDADATPTPAAPTPPPPTPGGDRYGNNPFVRIAEDIAGVPR